MKKILITSVLCLCSIFYGQDYTAEIYYKDGSIKKGILETLQKITGKNQIKYRVDSKAPKEKLSLDDVVKIKYTDKHGSVTAVPIVHKNKPFWVYEAYKGKTLTVYSTLYDVPQKQGGLAYNPWFTQSGYSVSEYFVKYKDDKPEYFGLFTKDRGPAIKIGIKKYFRKFLKFFDDKCPQLIEAYDNSKLKIKDDIYPVIDYFEEHCEK